MSAPLLDLTARLAAVFAALGFVSGARPGDQAFAAFGFVSGARPGDQAFAAFGLIFVPAADVLWRVTVKR